MSYQDYKNWPYVRYEHQKSPPFDQGLAIERDETRIYIVKCPECGSLQDRSTTIVPGIEVYRCRECNTYRIKGDDQVIKGGQNVMHQLRMRVNKVLAEWRIKEMMESDIEDPRWERIW